MALQHHKKGRKLLGRRASQSRLPPASILIIVAAGLVTIGLIGLATKRSGVFQQTADHEAVALPEPSATDFNAAALINRTNEDTEV